MSSLSPPQTLDQGSVQQHSSTRAIPAPAGLATELQQVGAPAVTALAAGEGSLSGRAPGEATGAAFGSPFEAPSLGPALSIGPPPPFGVALPTAPSGREQLAGEQPRLPRVLSIRASRRGSLNCSGDASSSPALQAAAAQQQQQQQAAARRPAPDVWGWLQPGRPSLPYVLLQGQGVVLGRGHDAIKERLLPPLMQSPSAPAADGGAGPAPRTPSGSFGRLPDSTSPLAAALAGGASAGAGTGPTSSSASISSGSPRRSGREAAPSPNATGRDGREAAFVEIADGRISRLHCWISRDASGHPYLEDASSNGTFLNGSKVPRGSSKILLRDGDRVSLVLSVAPLGEQSFIFRKGDPRARDAGTVAEWIEAAARMWAEPRPAGAATEAEGSSPKRHAAGRLQRTNTSSYTTAEAASSEDMQCTICLSILKDAVALEPCGHSYCAVCLSNHFAALLSGGQPLACPLRCSPPERVVANTVVRALVAARPHTPCLLRDGSHGSLLSAVPESHSDESSSRETSDRLAACGFLPGSAAAAADSGRNGGSGCPSMPMWLQLRLAEAMASSVLLEPHVEEVVCILINSGHLPTPDEDGCLELDLRALDATTLWELCEAVLGPVVAENELAAAMAGTALWRALHRLQCMPTTPDASPSTSPSSSQLPSSSSYVGTQLCLGQQALPSPFASPLAEHPARSSWGPAPAAERLGGAASTENHLSAGGPTASANYTENHLAGGLSASVNYSSALAALEAAAAAAAHHSSGSHWGGGSADLDELAHMNPLCPLYDDLLPLDAASLKSRQLALSVQQLHEAGGPAEVMVALEALARLAWSDDAAREEMQGLAGIDAIVQQMVEFEDDEAVQCTGALAVMALIRGDGPASSANKRRLAEAGGIEAVASALTVHRQSAMVQLSCMLCLVPLALEGSEMQVRIASTVIPHVLHALQRHSKEPEVVAKALVLLGVLAQGEEPLHDAIRACVITAGAPRALVSVLTDLADDNEEVLWAALFLLAVLLREASPLYVEHVLALASAGMLRALREALAAYRGKVAREELVEDDMISRAGQYLLELFERADHVLWLRRGQRAFQVAAWGMLALLAGRALRRAWRAPSRR